MIARQSCRPLVLALLLLLGLPAASRGAGRPDREDWQVIFLGGQRIGYSKSLSRSLERDGREIVISDSLVAMTIKRFGISLKMTVRQTSEEDAATGKLLKATLLTDNPPASRTEMSGVAEGNDFVMQMKTAGRVTESRITLRDDVKSPAWQERYLEEHPLKPGESATFKMFSPESAKIGVVTLNQLEPEETTLLDGSKKKLAKTVMLNSITPGVEATVYSDDDGRVQKMETNLLGMAMYAVSREEALKAIPETELDIGIDGLLKVEVADPHHAKSVTYRITTTSADPSTLFVDGGGQSVRKLSDSRAEVTVARETLPAAPAPAESCLKPSAFLDSADERVQALAAEVETEGKSPTEIATALVHFVHERVKEKTFSVAMGSASEVARELKGDCTEHAVLLAALLRVKKIPSRVAIGLVYVDPPKAFGGHMWTEAYLEGKWVPIDAAFNLAEVRSGHLKMADSDLADAAPAPVTEFIRMIHLWSGAKVEVVTPSM